MLLSSHGFVTDLDRSELGRFAYSDELLVLADKKEIVAGSDLEEWSSSHEEFLAATEALAIDAFYVSTELFYWWALSEAERSTALVNVRASLSPFALQMMNNRFSELDLIIKHQNLHDYFAIGIWDVAVAERFIAEDIDANIAIATLGEVSK